jgi:hypothetical protein
VPGSPYYRPCGARPGSPMPVPSAP